MAGLAVVLRNQKGLPPTLQAGERLRLLVLQGGDKGASYCLLGDKLSVGREACQINLPDTNISKKHAEIQWHEDHYSIRDLGSANGVLQNGKKIAESRLNIGDVLVLGTTAIQVCAAGQSKPGKLRAAQDPGKAKETQLNEKRKLILFGVIIFALYIAYSGSETHETHRMHTYVDLTEDEPKPATQKKKLSKEQAKREKERMKTVYDEYVPKYSANTPQRKDADKYTHDGVREYLNKNYRRAIKDFETALTIDPADDLAKLYLSQTKSAIYAEVQDDFKMAKEATYSLRYNEARTQYENIMRLLEVSRDDDSYKTDKYYVDAKEGLEKLDKLENGEK